MCYEDSKQTAESYNQLLTTKDAIGENMTLEITKKLNDVQTSDKG